MPKSFLVKKASRSKRRLEEEPCEDNDELSAAAAGQRAEDHSLESNATDDVGIQCNLETSVDFYLQRPQDNRHQAPHLAALDTRGLHTLAELCLRRADYESSTIIEEVADSKPEGETPVSTETDGFEEPRKLRGSKNSKCDIASIGLRKKLAKMEDDDDDDDDDDDNSEVEKSQDLIRKNKIITRPSTNTDESNGSRLEKLEEELEKMLQGKEEIIGREIREFMENNKALEEELTEETSVSQVEISKYLLEGVHLKDDKRKRLFRWYLEKKLSRMDSDDESFTCYKCGKIFAYESYLERHVKYVCPDKTGRTWKCSYCSKAFQYPCYLLTSFHDIFPSKAIGQGCGAQTVIFASSILSAVVIYATLGRFQDYVISVLIALGAGCLAGDSIFHLMPHALNPHHHHDGRTPESMHHVILWRSLLIVISVYFFYLFHILFYCSQASHSHSHVAAPVEHEINNSGTGPVKNIKAVVWMMVVGKILHTTSDGLAIGAAFSNSAGDGLSTSLAVLFHEIPHAVGVFAVFLSSGLPVYRALCLLTVCYLFSYIGVVVGAILGATLNLTAWIFAIIAGMFLYIALAEMFPEMFNAISSATSNRQLIIFLQNLGLLLGFIMIAILAGYEDQITQVLQ